MTKMKKLLLSLSVACVMCVALIVGLIASHKSPKPLVSGGGDYKF